MAFSRGLFLRTIEAWDVEIPLKIKFRHHLFEHKNLRGVYVKVQGNDPLKSGFGECLPRHFLTGESADSVLNWLAQATQFWFEADFEQEKAIKKLFKSQYEQASRSSNLAAASGLDIALYDFWSKQKAVPISSLLSQDQPVESKFKTLILNAPIGIGPWQLPHLGLFLARGFKRFKFKVTDWEGWEKLKAKMPLLSRLKCEVLIDCNTAFNYEKAKLLLAEAAECGLTAVEEPLCKSQDSHSRLNDLAIEYAGRISLIVDEHFCTYDDAKFFRDSHLAFNLRLGKNGGFTGVRELIRLFSHSLNPKSPKFMMGSLVGEGALMASATRTVRTLVSPEWGDVTWGDFLLEKSPEIFHQNKDLEPKKKIFLRTKDLLNLFKPVSDPIDINQIGLGVSLNEKILMRYALRYKKWTNI